MVELLIVAAIMGIIFSALFMTITTGQLGFEINAARIEVQSSLRPLQGWMVKDIRNAVLANISNPDLNVSESYLKIFQWDWGTNATDYQMNGDEYIEYAYYSANNTVKRSFTDSSGTEEVWYHNISAPPFYAYYNNSTDYGYLNATNLGSNKYVVVVLSSTKPVRDTNVSVTLKEQVRVRNE